MYTKLIHVTDETSKSNHDRLFIPYVQRQIINLSKDKNLIISKDLTPYFKGQVDYTVYTKNVCSNKCIDNLNNLGSDDVLVLTNADMMDLPYKEFEVINIDVLVGESEEDCDEEPYGTYELLDHTFGDYEEHHSTVQIATHSFTIRRYDDTLTN